MVTLLKEKKLQDAKEKLRETNDQLAIGLDYFWGT